MRLEAEVKVINNQIEQKQVYDIIRFESKNADIVFAGIPEINASNEAEFVEKTNKLLHEIGTVVLLKASSVFKNLTLGVNKNQEALVGITTREFLSFKSLDIKSSMHESLNGAMDEFSTKIFENYNRTFQNYTFNQKDFFAEFLEKFKVEVDESLSNLKHHFSSLPANRVNRFIVNYHHILFNKLNKLFADFRIEHFDHLRTLMETVIAEFDEGLKPLWKEIPETVVLSFQREAFQPEKNDSLAFKIFKKRKLSYTKKPVIPVSFPLRKYLSDLQLAVYDKFLDTIGETAIETVKFLIKFQNFLKSLSLVFDNFRKLAIDKNLSDSKIDEYRQTVFKQFNEVELLLDGMCQKVTAFFKNSWIKEVNDFIEQTENLKSVYYFERKKTTASQLKQLTQKLSDVGVPYFSNLSLLINAGEAENYLLQFNSVVNAEMNEILIQTDSLLKNELLNNIEKLSGNLKTMLQAKKQGEIPYDKMMPDIEVLSKRMEMINNASIKRFKRILRTLPSEITVMEETRFNDFFERQFEEIKTVRVAFLQMIEFLTDNKIFTQINRYRTDLLESITIQLNQIKEHYRLFLFSLDEHVKVKPEDKTSVKDFLNEQILKVSEAKNQIIEDFKQYTANITEVKSEISGQTTLYGLTKFESNLKHYIYV
ncbi:MAG: hypothetical protein L3J56_14685, partial [Bacteroidales bacterium]|nr:hypothetical protein [Bacteroidales bacterium]